jgi:hypothetical protein
MVKILGGENWPKMDRKITYNNCDPLGHNCDPMKLGNARKW